MPLSLNAHEKLESVYQLLQGETISIGTFERICTILKGLHPKVDEKLEICSLALNKLQKVQSGDVITLSVEGLPEDSEERKKRKKALLFFINSLKNLKSEIKRIDGEFSQANNRGNSSVQNQLISWGRIISFAKGPLGITTLIALVIVGLLFLQRHSPVSKILKVQVIMYHGKQIPLNQLYVGHGSDCDSPHYHATAGKVTALDGTVIPDPENCGYGKLTEVSVTEISLPANP